MARYVGALDQGTTSTRFMIFDRGGNEIARHQLEHQQIMSKPGWVEHDPIEIAARTDEVIARAMRNANVGAEDLAAIGVTNQRETTVVWNPATGRPWYNAIVWQDTRTDGIVNALSSADADTIRNRTGLPPATYFSATKLQWILENVAGVRDAAEGGEAIFGNIDTYVIWHLTGGARGGVHATDITNASRTMLMDLRSGTWDDELLSIFKVPRAMLPEICASSERTGFGRTRPDGPFGGVVAIAGDLGDQQAATVGQVCFHPGEAKNTYGTGNFMLLNTGRTAVPSKAGLLTTAAYRLTAETIYALEGSIAVTGSAVQWLRDQLGIIGAASEIETLAVLAFRCARRDRGPLAVQHQGASRARDARSDLLSDARGTRRDDRRFRCLARPVESGWRGDGERYADAASGRHPRRPRRSPDCRRDNGARRRLRRRTCGRLLDRSRRSP
jgi:glycerol kinase